ncbi:hypothetical protein FHS31_003096 [Sphingomonas vulcanisoli]|uniref:Uncharacterized protein n=1 Tax=Sphingomonas vulcanisoli TaxID=1658060 RepID=A0ABX0TXL6_9SPHN|nr:hypothetical protein [Sphingomonas vulcanisoli]NIJ09464.1 hypothetical protein [Sphingomonas vulcanisoli]
MPAYVKDIWVAPNFTQEEVDGSSRLNTFDRGNHLIPRYHFSNDGLWPNDEKTPDFYAYLFDKVERRGFKPISFNGKKTTYSLGTLSYFMAARRFPTSIGRGKAR